jgi:DNA polymerase I-like protein with 3'-5' exonuclease and polymerase domains/uracil-DNA glycosylase
MVVGEAPGEQEEREGFPFVGYSGKELDRILLEAGIQRSECFLTNVVRVRPPKNDISLFFADKKKDRTLAHVQFQNRFCLPVVMEGVELLKREIEMCRPNVIIALGNTALWALTGCHGITSWRGSMLKTCLDLPLDYQPKVLATYHPSLILRQWSWRPIMVQDLKRAKKASSTRELVEPAYDFLIEPAFGDVMSVLTGLINEANDRAPRNQTLRLTADIETKAGHIDCIGLAWNKLSAICIPFMRNINDQSHAQEGYWTNPEEEAQIIFRLYQLLTHPAVEVVGQNFHYDAQYIWRWWCFLPNFKRDTMLAQHSMWSNAMPKSLDFLASMYCESYVYWKDERKEVDPKISDRKRWNYNCKDCVYTYEVDEAEQGSLESWSKTWPQLRAIHDFQQKLYHPVLRTMNKGIRPNVAKRGAFAMTLMDEIEKRRAWLFNVVGRELNPKSPLQMQEFFYSELAQKPIRNREGGLTCNEEALIKIAGREPLLKPLIRKILELRSLGVFLSTFVNAPLDLDGRIRCSFNIGGTETYRFSSSGNAFGSGMNLQNIPPGGEMEALGDELPLELPNVRELFIPDPGFTWFDIDLSSADLKIVTWESDCREMKAMLAEGKSPYVEVAKEYYHDPSINKNHKSYTPFKSLCHGTHYLGTAPGLAGKLGLSVHEVERIQKWYFGKFPEIKRWQEDFKDQVAKRRYVENVFGYRYYFFDRIEGNTFNEAIAWLPQSTVACIINRGYVNIYDNLPEVDVLLQVHDSLAGQFPSYLGDQALRRIEEECTIMLPYADPMAIGVGVKKSTTSWGECG